MTDVNEQPNDKTQMTEDEIREQIYHAPHSGFYLPDDEAMRAAIAGCENNPGFVSEIITIYGESLPEDASDRQEVASETDNPDALVALAEDDDSEVRRCVALNPNTPVLTLSVLVKDRDETVRVCVAQNRMIPNEICIALFEDASDEVRRNLALNEKTPVSLLSRLVEDADVFVRACVAQNQRTPTSLLSRLLGDKDDYVAYCAQDNINERKGNESN